MERTIRRQRNSRRDNPPTPQLPVALEYLHLVENPGRRGIAQCIVNVLQVQIARATRRDDDVAHCFERYPDKEIQLVTVRLQVRVDQNSRWYIVRLQLTDQRRASENNKNK